MRHFKFLMIFLCISCTYKGSSPPKATSDTIVWSQDWEQAVKFVRDSVETSRGKLSERVSEQYEAMCGESLVCMMRFRVQIPRKEILVEGLRTYLDSAIQTEERARR